jgi:hypothetical protein
MILTCPNVKALAVASNKLFRNCLVSMRPKTKLAELPSSHDVGVYIHNECVKWLKQLKEDITVSEMSQKTVWNTHWFLGSTR